jgi:hypothetical protein
LVLAVVDGAAAVAVQALISAYEAEQLIQQLRVTSIEQVSRVCIPPIYLPLQQVLLLMLLLCCCTGWRCQVHQAA